jgi:protoporphyrinogen oxidase
VPAAQFRNEEEGMAQRTERALVIGAGPAGLTAAYELLARGGPTPLVLEKSDAIGGISRTAVYKGNRIDIGGHRFFSKSDAVMDWWTRLFPVAAEGEAHAGARVMLVRSRRSRILHGGALFEYPLALNARTLRTIRFGRALRMAGSYAHARLFPVREEKSLEDFLVNRFGRELYRTFFRDYTEKVWGVPCGAIKPEWGAQRIKGLSIGTALKHAVARPFARRGSIAQTTTETSLIDRFLYPTLGPGQLWEHVAQVVASTGGSVRCNERVVGLTTARGRITSAEVLDATSGRARRVEAEWFLSSMPVRDLIAALACGGADVPAEVSAVAAGLRYRSFITVGVLLSRAHIGGVASGAGAGIPDNWIYIQEPRVKLGRVQVFNNWSPYLVADPATVWLGLEYFCDEGDAFWSLPDAAIAERAVAELAAIGFADPADVLDCTVIRVGDAYPAYFGSYERFPVVREFLDCIENLACIGRNGMHRYNNQDHSMLTAMAAVEGCLHGVIDRAAIWDVNTEGEYHEKKSPAVSPRC